MKILSTSSNTRALPELARVAMAATACCAAWVAMPSVAQAEDTPLSLSLSQNLRRDSNILRTTEGSSDTVSTTAIQGNFYKAYGRQVYRASARFARIRYDKLNGFDNDAPDVNAGVTSEFASNWQVSLNAFNATGLVAFQDNPQDNRALRNSRSIRGVNGTVQYGNGGTWAVLGTFDNNRISYSESVPQFQNSQQSSQGLRLVYNFTDLLNFGLGPRWVRTRYPNSSNLSEVNDQNLDVTVNWQVTGVGKLNALLSRRDTEQGASGRRRIQGLTGSLGWGYTPRGRVSYAMNLTRATSADRFQETQGLFGSSLRAVQNVAFDTINTSLNLSASAPITGKISTGLSFGLTRYEQDNARDSSVISLDGTGQQVGVSNNASSTSSNSSLQSLTWSTRYAANRWLGVNCSLQFYRQSADLYRPKYDGHAVDCGASVTLDP